ncbi:4-hydroxythreonine-4-phosphate dehydrogenase PdxA [Verminephrobacter eiseniae]|uniref:4-hydroxythreonine-4-phosphate dehydrogenase n=1 Tax=Verminephrobacter eiseniae (strain EF01-2) TaxID=391735 RepID=A1WPT6_VEREI|nr:4-hydroxythreonine-4-phosphate dehydrogenase PdxA [Verminephrobacter eiseniae]ABM59643.1 4-hydroxythreonine-4-phosphate dehydrogenase [Verminephrobacter eiseniae EF01-2]MCW5259967.1 4-hydroxythreonine-4-phosphate dehydrogenase PdxA [Verminephrobacter eiseniae]MCW5285159.1 4-hydroxythreonine-4-phosphate dehydrogenase PdxA [Verminephrobacter eiseniae]MCW5302867.1 4-hydroxythreonine-4-phosphate dehydrogenase PdxA [Verminephrobacter eiseniae]MCW8181020.1 4-hydroxythreonine-4-phosphate dehydroge
MQTIAITQGDSAGIGPEIVAKAFRDAAAELHGCFVVGDVASLRRAAQALVRPGMPGVPVAQISAPAQALKMPPRCVPVLQLPGIPGPQPWGQVSAAAGRAAADSVVWAARAALRGEVAAIVTAPLHKAALAAAGVGFAGHTELLQAEAAAYQGLALERMPVRMMLANAELRTVLVSIHVSLRAAIAALTFGQLLQTLQITHAALTRSLGHAPRIAVAGLNPHAGEGGLFGREELEVIAPAIAAARAQGMQVHGPFAPDTVFMRARSRPPQGGEFDVVIAMYHDQGLIPIKYLGLDRGVNVTLGLPLVRTSPDHGTAFDIAGQGVADAASLIEAVRMARTLCGAGA